MTTKQQHPYAEILRAIADGEIIQLKTSDGSWADIKDSYAMLCMGVNCELRIKPRTIKIGEYEVPEPLRNAPRYGEYVFVADPKIGVCYVLMQWDGGPNHRALLDRGLVHLDKESAIAHAKALISVSQNK